MKTRTPEDTLKSQPETEHPRSPIFVLAEHILKLRKFLLTRNRVHSGDPVLDLGGEGVGQQNLMGPWTFNLYESVLAGLPALLCTKALDFLYPLERFVEYDAATLLSFSIMGFFVPFVIPMFMLVISHVAAWASLRRKDVSPLARGRSRRAFLYYDGAFGLTGEALVALAYSLREFFYIRGWLPHWGAWVILPLAVLGGIHIFYINLHKIPKLLFRLHGYASELTWWGKPIVSEKPAAPWHKYFFSIWILCGMLLGIMRLVFWIFANVMAHSLVWFRALVTGG